MTANHQSNDNRVPRSGANEADVARARERRHQSLQGHLVDAAEDRPSALGGSPEDEQGADTRDMRNLTSPLRPGSILSLWPRLVPTPDSSHQADGGVSRGGAALLPQSYPCVASSSSQRRGVDRTDALVLDMLEEALKIASDIETNFPEDEDDDFPKH